eukprot:CAMPEP_0182419230 /NCGR_PEP_ID=MMETSP1167-20130531/3649_1 /TAXON_ID=2988 /ORGANISM="Mallomonas Sp, Strain CCMP3275" /LENGTH=291 /DNA_ID=CAMNT_0024593965 /DNA_START=637 /DNA_END=1512 /DNA_ORIENTATION=+
MIEEGLKALNILPHMTREHIFIEPNHTYNHYMCFDELYEIDYWGILISSYDLGKRFRESLISPSVYNGEKEMEDLTFHALNSSLSSNIPQYFNKVEDNDVYQACRTKSLRIAIFQRSNADSFGDRAILNIEDVIRTCELFTRRQIMLLSTSMLDPPDAQFVIFNSFDILISVAGSHLSNMILINRTTVGIIEIGLAIRDAFWRENALQRLSLRAYVYCHGHGPRSPEDSVAIKKNCKFDNLSATTVCDTVNESWRVTDLSFYANIRLFRRRLAYVVNQLCTLPKLRVRNSR